MSDFAKLHATIFETAKRNLKESGNLAPTGILCRERDKGIHTIPFQWEDGEGKFRTISAFGATARMTEADYAYLVLDACIGSMEDQERGIMPVEKPLDDRREVIIVIGFDIAQGIEHQARIVEYRRSGSDRKTIAYLPQEKFDKSHSFDGEMVKWFREGHRLAGDIGLALKRQPKEPDAPAA